MEAKTTTSEKLTSLGSTFSVGRRVISLAWESHKPYTILLFFLVLVSAATPYMQLGVFGLIVDEVIRIISGGQGVFSQYLIQLLFVEFILLFLPLLITDSERSFGTMFRFIFLQDLNLKLVRKLADIDIATHESPEFSDKIQNARERGTSSIGQAWSYQLNILRNIIGVIIAGSILFSVHWLFLVFAFIGAAPALFIEMRYGKNVWWIWQMDAEKRRLFFDRRSHFFHLSHLIELKLFQGVDFFYKDMEKLLGGFTKKQVNVEKDKLGAEILGSLIFSITLAASIFMLIKFTIGGIIMVGTMTFIFGSIRGFQGTLISFFKNVGGQEEINRFAEGLFEIFDTENKLLKKNEPKKLEKQPPKIEFKNVWFKYPKTSTWVLKDFSLTIEPGENVSIVGVNGAGKTTFVKLLSRFYDPTKGEILINGHSLKDIDIEKWRSMTAVLFQEYADYSFPIKQAVAMGRSDKRINKKAVLQATQDSEASSFIEKFDKKYNQMLGKRYKDGVELSIGQKQRMAIARVFYRNAELTILDEPTASIDAEAEEKIFQTINERLREKTVITISHRFSTVKRSDKIIVIEKGKISEAGTHTELMKNNKTYARLYNLQASAYKD